MVFVRILTKLLRDKEIGDLIVPIVPDEARTFGMESLFRAVGIYSHVGQKYEPVDMDTLLYYKEAQDGQILEEGITEAGSMSSFIAAGTAYATHGVNTIPFFIYYSMFGFQRVGDLIWAGADSRVRGFLLGGTAGRTTLAGEGLQHQDGHSHVYLARRRPTASPTIRRIAYELAVIIQDGIRRMYREQESIFYYLTVMNEQYAMPPMPDGIARGHPEGHVPLADSGRTRRPSSRRSCFGSGAILNEVVGGAEAAREVRRRRRRVERHQLPGALSRRARRASAGTCCTRTETPRVPYVTQCLKDAPGVLVAASDYLKVLPDSIDRWMPRRMRALGTDGFGRSEDRASAARVLRGRRAVRHGRDARRAGSGRADRSQGRRAGHQGPRHQPREAESGRAVRVHRS